MGMTSIRQRMSTTLIGLGIGLGSIAVSACAADDDGDDPIADTSGGESETTLGIAEGGDGDGDGEAETDDTAETGELMGCAAIDDADACLAEPGCGPTMGTLLMEDGEGGVCIAAEDDFVGCASTSELCPPLPKTLCGEGTMWQTNGCVPGNVTPCEAPAEISGPC